MKDSITHKYVHFSPTKATNRVIYILCIHCCVIKRVSGVMKQEKTSPVWFPINLFTFFCCVFLFSLCGFLLLFIFYMLCFSIAIHLSGKGNSTEKH